MIVVFFFLAESVAFTTTEKDVLPILLWATSKKEKIQASLSHAPQKLLLVYFQDTALKSNAGTTGGHNLIFCFPFDFIQWEYMRVGNSTEVKLPISEVSALIIFLQNWV